MEPKTYQLAINTAGVVVPGKGILAAYVPATSEGPAVIALAADPRHDPGQPIISLVPTAIGYIHDQLRPASDLYETERQIWVVIDSYGRFQEALPVWSFVPGDAPTVMFRRFPGGTGVDAMYQEAGAGGEVVIELLSAIIEAPVRSDETPSALEFLGAVEAHGNLPAPGVVFHKIELAAADGDAKQMAALIQADPVLSTSLINSANAARFANAGKTASVPQAIIRLGTNFVRRVVFVAEMMARYQKGACGTFNYRGYWMNAIATGAAMRGLMNEFDLPAQQADDAFTVGLLSSIGWLVLAETFPVLMTKYLERCAGADPISKAHAQQEIFPAPIRAVAERYLERFDFPPLVAQTIGGRAGEAIDWFDCLARATRVAQALAPCVVMAVPSTVAVPDICREEWERWRTMLAGA